MGVMLFPAFAFAIVVIALLGSDWGRRVTDIESPPKDVFFYDLVNAHPPQTVDEPGEARYTCLDHRGEHTHPAHLSE
jgi:hypothetical protein